ncbi:MAG TPA: hypothetical protein VK988_01015 [Acidimicrobiales bacterium]|nr:hypothetical protein [Acidimicrobiales bacterium]
MAHENPVAEALSLLEQREASLSDELRQVREAVVSLRKVVGMSTPAPPTTSDRNRPSVRTKLVTLLEEEARDWSAGEIIHEYERRGDPIHGRDPANALRAAFADAKKQGWIVSTGVGRYKAAKWDQAPEKSSPDSEDNWGIFAPVAQQEGVSP